LLTMVGGDVVPDGIVSTMATPAAFAASKALLATGARTVRSHGHAARGH
jgi:hypothetical protein